MPGRRKAIVSRIVDPTDLTSPIRSLRQALALDSTNADAWHYLAMSLAESGDMDDAIAAWRRSVSSAPSYTQGITFLALGHYWHHQYDSAARWVDSAIALRAELPAGSGRGGLRRHRDEETTREGERPSKRRGGSARTWRCSMPGRKRAGRGTSGRFRRGAEYSPARRVAGRQLRAGPASYRGVLSPKRMRVSGTRVTPSPGFGVSHRATTFTFSSTSAAILHSRRSRPTRGSDRSSSRPGSHAAASAGPAGTL